MARNLTAHFLAAAASKSAKPYSVLEIQWKGGTQFYLDRPSNSFSATGARVPSSGVDSSVMVMQWPSVSISLKEGAVGATDQTQAVLDDHAGALTALLNAAEQQRVLVKLWRMFDDPAVVWGTDNALIFVGCLRPFSWTAQDNQITLAIGDLGPLLAKSIGCTASKDIFTKIPVAYQDKNIPLCWGQAQRVEAVLVQAPFETTITQGIVAGNGPITVTIGTDPDDMGVDGTGATQYTATIGTQTVTVTFTQSATPGNGTSTATISNSLINPLATALIEQVTNAAGYPQLAINTDHIVINDPDYGTKFTLDTYFPGGWPLTVVMHTGGNVTTTLVNFYAHEPFVDNLGIEWYIIAVSDPGGYIQTNIQIGDTIQFMNPNPPIDNWPAGTILKQVGVDSVYVANCLPSKNVIKVEGFGTCTDSAGQTRKDFIPLGQYVETIISGSSTTTLTGNTVIDNLNDNTWNNPVGTLLGQNVTTITFPGGTPRDLFMLPDAKASLDDNRIWVTLDGVEDAGNSTGNVITNPALILLHYLENTHLMNVDSGSINTASFTAAASLLAGYSCGFAQVEATDGLSLLQHIASLCHSVVFFDQGAANMVVLSDSPGTIQWTGDTTAHDNLKQGTLTHSESAVDDVINDLTFKWCGFWDDKTGNKLLDSKNVKLLSVAAFGRIAKEINCDIYWRREDVATERDWWLGHLSSIFRYVAFTAFLDALVLQPGDWLSLEWIDGGGRNLFGGAKTMQVTKCSDTGKDGLVTIEARYVVFSYA